ncbi:protein FAM3C-like [Seriola lalandi dorsalis]|uniref:FAM3 metabolism regulating signaling molecule D n=1 Tax=Seriola lalandi dorsalis TaxID=1841481 RepID=A0A3B4YRZ2_SERLL|nr:protein FAM3C-like [Seriola lalandi dorsalis]
MRYQATLYLAVVIAVLLMTWIVAMNLFDVQQKTSNVLAFSGIDKIKLGFQNAINQDEPQCSISTVCPPNHSSIQLRSGAANIIGPKICFDGKTIMSHVMNNVGRGLNIVVLNGETGAVEKFGYLNMRGGNANEILAYLKEIKTGSIVLVASYDDVAEKLTDEMREIFVEMGSSLITSVRTRDSWVFAGRAGTEHKSLFEKQAVNDAKTNVYEGWPDMVEVSGCFPRTDVED